MRSDILVSFRSQPSLFPERSCALRIQTESQQRALDLEAILSKSQPPGFHWGSEKIAGATCFRIEGSFEMIERFCARQQARAPTDEQTDGSFEQQLRTSVVEAIRAWKRRRFVLQLPRGRRWELVGKVAVLGVLNVTPDSFSDGGRYAEPDAALRHALEMLKSGADAIDVGGESTRPGSRPVSSNEEIRRIGAVIARLRKETDAPISVDTYKSDVAKVALDEGADIVNDITALEGDAGMLPLLQERKVPVVIMHMQGRPRSMQDNPYYDNATAEIVRYLWKRLVHLDYSGISLDRIVVDPGFGFGKRSVDNLHLLRDVNEFRSFGRPVLIGLSRKSFLGALLGSSVEDREAGTLVANTIGTLAGVSIIRTHQIPNAREMAVLLQALDNNQVDQ